MVRLIRFVRDPRIVLGCAVARGQKARVGHAPLSHYLMEDLLDSTCVGIFRLAFDHFGILQDLQVGQLLSRVW